MMTTTISNSPISREYVESVSTFICPAKSDKSSGSIQFGGKGTKSTVIDKKNRTFKKSPQRAVALTSKARAVDGDSATPIVVTSKSATWLALEQCKSSAGEFWFIGGTADVSSLGYFQFTNENLGKAILEVELWSEDGSESSRTLTIPARSTKNYSLTTFTPGKKLTAFHLISRSGLVSATLFDERRKGLTTYGGDYVTSNPAPSKQVMMIGIPGTKFAKNSKLSAQKLRLFVPGESDAVIQVNYISPSGVFAPVGLDSIRVPAQRVVEVDLANLPKDRLYSLEVRSSEPLIASTLTRGSFDKQRELLWSSPAEATRGEPIALPEQSGFLSIVTAAKEVNFTVVKIGGSRSAQKISVDSMAVWKVPDTARTIEFTTTTDPIYLAFTMRSPSGVSTTTLAPAQAKELTALPIVDSDLYIPTAK